MPNHRFILLTLLIALSATPILAQSQPDIIRQYHRQRATLRPDDLTAHSDLATWCESHNLYREASYLYRHILRVQPDNFDAYNALIPLAISLGPTDPTKQIQQFTQQFTSDYKIHQSTHFLIVYNTSGPYAENIARMLELTYKRFMDIFSWADFRPILPDTYLQVILFKHHDNFIDYAKRVDGKTSQWFQGYYSARTNRIALYDSRTSPKMLESTQLIDQLTQSQLKLKADLALALKTNNQPLAARIRRQLNNVQSKLRKEKPRYDTITALTNIAHSIHETTHQLAFNSGIQKRGVTYPIWFSEGITTSFETVTPAVQFGPLINNSYRQNKLRKATRRNNLIPPDRFVSLANPPENDDEHRSVAYAQSWAMFHYLFNHRQTQLQNYMRMKLTQKTHQLTPNQLHNEFVQFFGPPKHIQQAMISYALNLN